MNSKYYSSRPRYPQPHSLAIPYTGNPLLEDHMREQAHHSAKYEARRKHKDKLQRIFE